MIDLIRDIIKLLSDIFNWFTGRNKKPVSEKTSERIDEEDIQSEEVGDLTMIADKMLERLNKRRKK